MKLPLRWLKEYVDYNVTNEEFVEKMMWRGFEIAEVIDEMPGIKNVVVCKVIDVKPHENAEKLNVCLVDIGEEEPLQIVTNAKYLKVGDIVPVALSGATLSGGFEIKPTKMRGVESFGMFCGGAELNLTDADYPGASEDKVLIFREEHKIGQSIQEAVGLDSVIFDIELTPNRSDCQSIIGICREAAAALGQKFKEPEVKHIEGSGNEADYASVTIENTKLCPRYTARVVVDLKIEPSPEWMQKKLRSVGLRPINNIVDITNYVLVEYGHPMHAFDLACISDGAIVVRNAQENEKVTTLDGKERICDSSMLLIADPQKGVGLAGVMGGENSEITAETKAALFESAVFIASNIRSTSRKLHHTTDAAQRFMRGVEPDNAYRALERAVELVEELGAGRVVGKVIDVCHSDLSEKVINVDTEHINRILGTDFTGEYMKELLSQINIEAEPHDDGYMTVHVPPYRVDIEDSIESDADIAEEVARLHGYYRLETKLMYGDTYSGHLTESFRDDDKIHDLLASMGAYEMYNYNFMAPSALDILKIPEGDEKRLAVKILNPFGEDQSLMRTTLIPGMLESLSRNVKRKTGYGRFFEVGNVHFDNNDDLPEERRKIGIAYMGDEDFFTLKGTAEQLFEAFHIDARFKVGGGEYLCPGKKAQIYAGDVLLGELGALHPDVAKAYDLPQTTFIAEIDVKNMLANKGGKTEFKPLPKFPSADRDIALLVPDEMLSDEIKDAIYAVKTDVIIENVKLFDVYKGKGIPEGQKSVAYSFSLRRDDRTLTDEDIAAAMNRIIKTLEHRLGVKLRG